MNKGRVSTPVIIGILIVMIVGTGIALYLATPGEGNQVSRWIHPTHHG